MSPAYEAVEVFDSLIKQDFFNYLTSWLVLKGEAGRNN